MLSTCPFAWAEDFVLNGTVLFVWNLSSPTSQQQTSDQYAPNIKLHSPTEALEYLGRFVHISAPLRPKTVSNAPSLTDWKCPRTGPHSAPCEVESTLTWKDRHGVSLERFFSQCSFSKVLKNPDFNFKKVFWRLFCVSHLVIWCCIWGSLILTDHKNWTFISCHTKAQNPFQIQSMHTAYSQICWVCTRWHC